MVESRITTWSHIAQIIVAIVTCIGIVAAGVTWILTSSNDLVANIYRYEYVNSLSDSEFQRQLGDGTGNIAALTFSRSSGFFYRIDVRNLSRQSIRDVRVDLDGAQFHGVTRTRGPAPLPTYSLDRITGPTATIPEIPPENSMSVYFWSSSTFINSSNLHLVSVTWPNGSAGKDFARI